MDSKGIKEIKRTKFGSHFMFWVKEREMSRRSRVPESRQLDMMVPLPEVGKTEEGKELWYNEYVFTF